MKRNNVLVAGLVLALVMVFLNACSEPPRHTLSAEEKQQDLNWLFKKIADNYAPLDLKTQKWGVNFNQLKQTYAEKANQTKSNDEFSLLMHRLVAEFKDGHTVLQAPKSNLRHKVRMAYLGFNGQRKGQNFLVKRLLPSIAPESGFPIKVDDEIVRLDGVSIANAVKKELVPYRDFGSEEANLSYLFPKLFNRISNVHPFPQKLDVELAVKRKDREFTVSIPWIIKDVYDYANEQEVAERTLPKTDKPASAFWGLTSKALSGELDLSAVVNKYLSGQQFWNHFMFLDSSPNWGSAQAERFLNEANHQPTPSVEALKQDRNVPAGAVFVGSGKPFAAYVFSEKLPRKDKEPQRVRPIGYVYLDEFADKENSITVGNSIAAAQEKAEQKAVASVSEVISAFKSLGVRHVIIDLLNNPGGSLTLGLRVAQEFYSSKLIYPDIQFRVNDAWLDAFEQTSLNGLSDSEREIARRVYETLEQDRAQGLSLSRKHSVENLLPFRLASNPKIDEDFDMTLLVNEGCASMCDIFAALLKENRVATLVGARTMGAGGNVQNEGELPNSHMVLQQTRSLLVRRDGSYLENNGVEPDEKMDVSATEEQKYDGVIKKAVELIINKP